MGPPPRARPLELTPLWWLMPPTDFTELMLSSLTEFTLSTPLLSLSLITLFTLLLSPPLSMLLQWLSLTALLHLSTRARTVLTFSSSHNLHVPCDVDHCESVLPGIIYCYLSRNQIHSNM